MAEWLMFSIIITRHGTLILNLPLLECMICLQTGNVWRCVWVALKVCANMREREHLTLKLCYPLLIDTAFQVSNMMEGNFMPVSSDLLLIGEIPQNLINAFS